MEPNRELPTLTWQVCLHERLFIESILHELRTEGENHRGTLDACESLSHQLKVARDLVNKQYDIRYGKGTSTIRRAEITEVHKAIAAHNCEYRLLEILQSTEYPKK